MTARTAFITGILGQDGAYLAKLLLGRGYRVVGQMRQAAQPQTGRLASLGIARDVELLTCDLLDTSDLARRLGSLRPDEIYNLASVSTVSTSFANPTATFESNALVAARLLEAAHSSVPEVRFFQPSSSEMFGGAAMSPQNESTPFRPCSPYAVAKVAAHWLTVSYRESHGFFGACGILFNHESPLRGPQFVTRKVTSGLAEIKRGRRERITLGNLDVQRDWGFAGDYVDGMWRILQRPAASDYVLATGVATSVRRLVELAAEHLEMRLQWSGSGFGETAIDRDTGKIVVAVDPQFFRPTEVVATVGDASRAHAELAWRSTVDLPTLVAMMVEADERRLLEHKAPA